MHFITIAWLLLMLINCPLSFLCFNNEDTVINIGLILAPTNEDSQNASESLLFKIENHLQEANDILEGKNKSLHLITTILLDNSLEMSNLVCERLIRNKVSAVIMDTNVLNEQFLSSVATVSFTLGLYNVPVIGTTLRDSSLFNKNLHSSYISLIPPYSHQADVWFKLMQELKFKSAFVLTSSENRDLLSRLVNLIDQQKTQIGRIEDDHFRIEQIIEFNAASYINEQIALEHLKVKLRKFLDNSICRVFLIHAQTLADVNNFISIIQELELNRAGFALIFSEETTQLAINHNISIPEGVLSSRLKFTNTNKEYDTSVLNESSSSYISDAFAIVVQALIDIFNSPETSTSEQLVFQQMPQLSCELNPSLVNLQTGLQLYASILSQNLSGSTGQIVFNEEGDRVTAKYSLLNFVDKNNSFKRVGYFSNKPNQEAEIYIDFNSIQWPGQVSGKLISGVFINQHLNIATIQEKPFVWALADDLSCWNNPPNAKTAKGEILIPCKRLEKKFCCKGYCIDLLDEISRGLNFTYDLHLVPDNQYGVLTQISPSEEEGYEWTGLMGELVSKRADMAFAPLTITAARAQAIDFSKPFKFHGFSILLRKASKHTTLASFLQPFHNQLWVLVIGVATHVVALTLYLLDRYSTFGQYGIDRNFIRQTPSNANPDDHPLHLSSSLWFSWSILLNSGVGEHTPKSLSSRVLGIFWSGFAMIVVASYTANLAAFLVLDSREETPSLTGIDDPRLRTGELAFNFATVKGSAVDAFLQSQVEYINLYRKMEEFNYDNVDALISGLRAGSIDALIWDSTRLEWEVASDEKCSLGIAGELFGSSGYGIGLQRNSYWTKNVTTKLLELHENGFMIDLDKKWVTSSADNNCEQERDEDNYPKTLGVFNIAGVFILFACGLLASFALIIIERKCFNHT